MLFQTNTTISLISSVLMFLTKNTLCSATQQTNNKNYPCLQTPSQANQEDEILTGALKDMMLSENKELGGNKNKEKNEEYKKIRSPTETEKSEYEFEKLGWEAALTSRKNVFQPKKDFTKENYEEYLKHVDGFIEKLKNLQSKYSSVLTDERKKLKSFKKHPKY